jgi:hypothetical protein
MVVLSQPGQAGDREAVVVLVNGEGYGPLDQPLDLGRDGLLLGHSGHMRTLAYSPDGPAPRSADKQMQGQELTLEPGTPQRTPMPLRLLWWSFSQSFHQGLLQPTRPHSTECLLNLTCLEPTGAV